MNRLLLLNATLANFQWRSRSLLELRITEKCFRLFSGDFLGRDVHFPKKVDEISFTLKVQFRVAAIERANKIREV